MRRFFSFLALFGVLLLVSHGAKAQFYSVSSNLLGLASGSINAEVSMTVNRSWSLHASGSLNPWKIEQFRTQHLSFRPEARWWFAESYRGWYVGAHAHAIAYHFSIPKVMKLKREGLAYGLGADLGYAFALSPKWNLELGFGAGLYYADSWLGKCVNCSFRSGEEKKFYVLPDKAAVSLVYLF